MQVSPRKNKCMMNCSGVISTLLMLITGFVVYSYVKDTKEEADPIIIAITLIMNLGGSIYCLISVGTKDFALYSKLKWGLYLAMGVFTVSIVVYCFVIIDRGKNYDDLVALIICYVMFLIAYICALQLYSAEDSSAEGLLAPNPLSGQPSVTVQPVGASA